MYPFVKLGFLQVQSFSLLLAIGALLAVFVALKSFSRYDLPLHSVFHLATISIIAGTIGSRLFYIIEFYEQYHWQMFNIFDGGWRLWGFFLGATIFISRRYYTLLIATTITFYFRSKQIYILPIFLTIAITLFFHAIYAKKYTSLRRKSTYIGMLVCGIFFARIMFLYESFDLYSWGIFKLHRGGMTVYGGLLLSLLCCGLYVLKYKMPLRKTFDILITVTFLALAFGRVGCFMNGCCFGKDCQATVFFSNQFPTNSPSGFHHLNGLNIYYLWNSYTPEAKSLSSFLEMLPKAFSEDLRHNFFPRVYATQLISAIYNMIIFLFLCFLLPRKRYDGQVFLYGICFYSVCRFCVEMFRGDNPLIIEGLTGAQCISFALFSVSVSLSLFNAYSCHKKRLQSAV
ncbi:prolipoprotein diacylglyceryl transferase [Candidatus Uabimicrobium sp. HlEnr_7]|uniref:prolipoprotein diacylglyceryl transferase n=1 Tax=Candidatus Uabimicrobium helgolandensis TaxID=3095367 RepID=UPI0035582C91